MSPLSASSTTTADVLAIRVQMSTTTPPVALVAQERLGGDLRHGCNSRGLLLMLVLLLCKISGFHPCGKQKGKEEENKNENLGEQVSFRLPITLSLSLSF